MTAPWTRDEASASGQVFEFRLWAALAEQSRGSHGEDAAYSIIQAWAVGRIARS